MPTPAHPVATLPQFHDETAVADARICVLNLQLGTGSALMTPALVHAGIEALSTTLRDPDIHVIVLTGSSQQFCLGVQAPEASEREKPHDKHSALVALDASAFIDALHDWLLALRESDKPILAAVEGQASGAGLALALACDLIVAARNAQFQLPATGQAAGRHLGALWLAAQRLPSAALAELCLLDNGLSAERAHTLGLACRLCEPGLSLQTAMQLARPLALKTPTRLAQSKQYMAQATTQTLHEALADERARWLRTTLP
jgi:enoyl-CoA hydratase/carnithine racemase